MPIVTIDGQEFEVDELSEEARQQLVMLQATDQEIQRLQVLLAIAQTARNAYAPALKSLLPSAFDVAMARGDSLKLS
ncbi:DUF6447 family protein [Accumulibacter sp.]|uniref:DUF6447 family protein n=1 Tax=Accumulibacter sp. TaxID=2053492 RepID=UPI0028C433EC|nr:DUF6447 family protein [Accumulibacter sp.]